MNKIFAVIISLGVIIGGWIYLDDRYDKKFALADELKKTNQQLQLTNYQHRQHILQEQILYFQRQMYEIQNRCSTSDPHKMPQDSKARYQDFTIKLKNSERELNTLGKE